MDKSVYFDHVSEKLDACHTALDEANATTKLAGIEALDIADDCRKTSPCGTTLIEKCGHTRTALNPSLSLWGLSAQHH